MENIVDKQILINRIIIVFLWTVSSDYFDMIHCQCTWNVAHLLKNIKEYMRPVMYLTIAKLYTISMWYSNSERINSDKSREYF